MLKAPKPPGMPYGLTPEVFGAWFTGYGKMDEINYKDDVRVMQPSQGLKQFYDQRAGFWNSTLEKSGRPSRLPTPKKEATKPADDQAG